MEYQIIIYDYLDLKEDGLFHGGSLHQLINFNVCSSYEIIEPIIINNQINEEIDIKAYIQNIFQNAKKVTLHRNEKRKINFILFYEYTIIIKNFIGETLLEFTSR